ncbi:MAG: nitrous oxide reductase family maturation protein NosD [Promethearchaeota archaeon]
MKNEINTKTVILALGIILTLSIMNNILFLNKQFEKDSTLENRDKFIFKNLKKSSVFNGGIQIDATLAINTTYSGNWTWAVKQPWCYVDNGVFIIEDLIINAGSSPTGSGIYISNSKNHYFIIRNCTVYNASSTGNDAGIKLENTNNGTLTNNYCSDNGNWGIYLFNTCENNTILGNTASDNLPLNQDYGIYLSGHCDNNSILGNNVNDNSAFGIYLYNDCNNNNISGNNVGNNFTTNQNHGIYLAASCDNNTVSRNTLYDNDEFGIWLNDHSSKNNVSGNTINGNRMYGIYLYSGCNNNTISGNSVNDSDAYGIYIWINCDDNNVTGNTANNNEIGIYLNNGCDNNNISGNSANNNGEYGINLSYNCNDNNVTGNTANDNGIGIYLNYGCNNNNISGNSANNNGEYGIQLSNNCHDNNVTGNFANDNNIGISLHDCDDNNIKNNTINRNELGVLLYQSNYNNVSDNILKDNECCIYEYECTTNIIENNDCSGSTLQAPIFIDGTATGVGAHNWTWAKSQPWCSGSGTWTEPYIIENLKISGFTLFKGIEIINSNVSFIIQNCTVFNSDYSGIYLHNVNNSRLVDNNCSNNDNGIYLYEGCNNNTILGNTANDNIDYGIYLYEGCNNNTILGNTAGNNFTTNQNSGIYLYNGCNNNTISGNSANGNSNSGIYLYNGCSNNTISGNFVNDNINMAILLQTSDNNNIKNNTINRNELGVLLYQSNYNNVSSNILKDNGYCILEYECANNIIENNNCSGSTLQAPIFIDGTATGVGAHNWTWAKSQPWCSGSGTWTEPYIIENLKISGFTLFKGIEIINSNVSFIIQNCTVFNSDNSGIYLHNVNNSRLVDNNCSNNGLGIFLDEDCNNNTISENTVNSNGMGIYLYDCDNSTILGNTISYNLEAGIFVEGYCYNNTFANNVIINNGEVGIYLYDCDNSTILGNTIKDHEYGIWFDGEDDYNEISENVLYNNTWGISIKGEGISYKNLIYENFFLKNGKHAYDEGVDNKWNSTTIGNYWDNHTGPDTDPPEGIVDNPYTYIGGSAGSIDYLPIADDDAPTIYIDSPIPDNVFGSVAPSFSVRITEDYLDTMWYTLDGGLHNYTFIVNETIYQPAWNAVPEGNVTLTFYASDKPGNIGTAEVIIVKDFEVPTIKINSPTSEMVFGASAPSFNVRITEDYLDTMWYTLDGGLHNYTFIANETIYQPAWNAVPEGNVTLTFYATDDLEHIGSAGVIIVKDYKAPTIKINSPTTGVFFGSSAPSFNVRITEDYLDTMWYTLDGGLHNYTFTANGTIYQPAWNSIVDGAIILEFFANDTLGHIGSSGVTLHKDTVFPIIIINSPAEGERFGSSAPSFNVRITEDYLDTMWYTLDGGLTNYTIMDNGTLNQDAWTALAQGEVNITFYASDLAGNEVSESVTVIKNIPAEGIEPVIIIIIVIVSIIAIVVIISTGYIFMKKRATPEEI